MIGHPSSDQVPTAAARLRPRHLVAAAVLAIAASALAAQPPEPPLPERSTRAAREAAAAIQPPSRLQPPPLPPGVSFSPPAVSAEKSAQPPGSPIPPQSGAAPAVPPPPASSSSVRGPAFPSQVTTSTSRSGQFVVHGPDLQVRSYFAAHCDEVAAQLRQVLRDDQSWSLPIVVALKLPPDIDAAEPAVKTSISKITHGGFHLQLALQVRHDLRLADLDRELIRILLAERILRPHKDIATARGNILPDWLLTGVSQALAFRTRSRPSAVFAAVFRTGRIYGIEEILSASAGDLDALSRAIYETSCCALVLALLDQHEGPARFGQFLSLLAADNREDRELLTACFPSLALSSSSLNKWWSIQMASLATPSVFETLGPTATKNELEAALMFACQAAPAEVPRQTRAIAAPQPDAPPGTAEEPPAEEKKRGLLGRMFGGNSEKKDEAEAAKADSPPPPAAEAKKEEPKEEPKKEQPKETPKPKAKDKPQPADEGETEKRPGLIRRMFGGGNADDGEAKKEEPAKKAAAKPKPEVKEALPPKPKAKPKKEDAEPPADEPKKDAVPLTPGTKRRLFGSQAAWPSSPDLAALFSDYLSWQTFSLSRHPILAASPRHTALFGKKKKAGEEAEPEKEEASKKTEAKKEAPKKEEKKKEEPKEQPKAESKPAPKPEPKAEPKADKKTDDSEAAEEDKPKRGGLFSIFGRKTKDEPDADSTDEPEKPKAAAKPKSRSKPATPAAAAPSPGTVPVSIPLEDYPAILKRKDRTAIIDRNVKALNLLLPRSHVLFRPIVSECSQIMIDLNDGKTKDMDKRIAAVRSAIAAAWKQGKAVEEHLDWFEASETKNYSGFFEDYLSLPDQIQKEAPARTDAISEHLDELEGK